MLSYGDVSCRACTTPDISHQCIYHLILVYTESHLLLWRQVSRKTDIVDPLVCRIKHMIELKKE